MLGSVIAARGRKYLMMNAPATKLTRARGPAPGPRVAVGHPARPRGDDRDPLGRRLGRGLGPPAQAQGRRRVGDPRPADREDPAVTALGRSRDPHAAPPRPARARCRDAARARRPVPARRRPGPCRPRRGPRDPRRRPRARRRRRPRGRRALRRRAARWPAAHRAGGAARGRGRAVAHRSGRARDRHRQRPPVRGGAATGHHAGPRSSTASSSSAAGSPSVAPASMRPAARRPTRARSSWASSPRWSRAWTRSSSRRPADRDGNVHPVLLGAAGLLEVDALLVAGGVQAIGALAYGLPTEGLAPMDLVVGPGSAWVTAAKVEIAGEVGIDLPAGPSEGLVLADATADAANRRRGPRHAGRARPGLARPARDARRGARRRGRGRGPPPPCDREPPRHPRPGPRATTAGSSSSRTSTPASTFVNDYAPEHLSVDVEDARAHRRRGSATPARSSSAAGARRAPATTPPAPTTSCPTGGLARACGPLAVETFGKFNQVQRITREGLATLRPAIRALAEAEGLLAHRDAVEARFEDATPVSTPPRRPPDEPEPVRGDLAHRSRLLQLGGDRRGRRRAVRHPGRRRSCGSTSTRRPPRPRCSPACSPPTGSRRRCRSTRPATTAGSSRRPRPAMASRSTRSCPARARTRSSTCARRRSCPPARPPSSRSRPTRCTASTRSSAAAA